MKSTVFRFPVSCSAPFSLLWSIGISIGLAVALTLATCHRAAAASDELSDDAIVMLEWDTPADTVHHYVLKIEQSGDDNTSDPAVFRAYTDERRYALELTDDGLYTVRVQAVDMYGNASDYSGEVSFTVEDAQIVAKSSALEEGLPESFALLQNYPNPFNPATTIQFDVPVDNHVKVTVFNVTGQKVAELVDEVVPAGSHTVRWDAGDMPSGVYVYTLISKSVVQTKKMMLVK